MLSVKVFEFNPLQENTYVVYDEFNNCIIIDPGCLYDDEKDALVKFIGDTELKPVMLLNTHCHLDHVFGNKFVAERYNLKLNIHETEKRVLELAPLAGLGYNLPFDNYDGELAYLKEDGQLSIGKDELKILFTPGHSPGSLSFYSKADHFVVSGDALFKGSIGRTDLPGGEHETLLHSIRKNLFTLPDETKVYSGHGPATTIGIEKRTNPFFV